MRSMQCKLETRKQNYMRTVNEKESALFLSPRSASALRNYGAILVRRNDMNIHHAGMWYNDSLTFLCKFYYYATPQVIDLSCVFGGSRT
jgi:hypothetical protein